MQEDEGRVGFLGWMNDQRRYRLVIWYRVYHAVSKCWRRNESSEAKKLQLSMLKKILLIDGGEGARKSFVIGGRFARIVVPCPQLQFEVCLASTFVL